MIEALLARFEVARHVAEAARAAARRCAAFEYPASERVKAAVLRAFYDEGLAEYDLRESYGYGYDDVARVRYESLLARIFGAEAILARLSLVSGTQAIVTALDAVLPSGGKLVAATGRPYDTLRNAIADARFSLVERGVRYDEVQLRPDGAVDFAALARASDGADIVFVQRSRGYAARPALSAQECGNVARAVKASAPQAVVVADNCYAELVEDSEPTQHGVDVVAGSLLKNLGGGLAPGGAYVAGRAEPIAKIAARHYAPGLDAGVGPSFGFGRSLIHGLFMAPAAVAESLAGLDFFAALFEELGYRVDPAPGARRCDIVQAIALDDVERVLAFARGLQSAMPVNAHFRPEAGPVPGYVDPIVMSSGAFISGSTIELSADAPLRPPFEVYVQGGTRREHAMLGALLAAEAVAAS